MKRPPIRRLTTSALILIGLAGAPAGCHSPAGPLLPYTGASQTIYSTETRPMTMRLVDTRTGDVVFTLDIPVGRQLTYDFNEDGGDDPVLRPSSMRWEIMDLGRSYGRLANSQPVPNRFCRRVDLFVRDGAEYQEMPAEFRLRTDEEADRPDWWSPGGGRMPSDDSRIEMYDD